MKKASAIFILAIFAFTGCKKDSDQRVGTCLEARINNFRVQSYCNDARVDEYTFQGRTVYVFESGTCGNDMSSEVVDSQCDRLGLLGGFGGNYIINGENFSNATFLRTVWTK